MYWLSLFLSLLPCPEGLSPGSLASVIQKVDNAHWIAQYVLLTLIHWIAIYSVDSIIRPLNNWVQVFLGSITSRCSRNEPALHKDRTWESDGNRAYGFPSSSKPNTSNSMLFDVEFNLDFIEHEHFLFRYQRMRRCSSSLFSFLREHFWIIPLFLSRGSRSLLGQQDLLRWVSLKDCVTFVLCHSRYVW